MVELGGQIVDQDLRKAPLTEAVIADTDFLRCRLDGAYLFGAVFQRGSVVECGVRRADLRDALIVDTRWQSIDLAGARTNRLAAERTTFEGCTFPPLNHVEFRECSFVGCRFTGRLSDVQFLGGGVLQDVVFSSDDFRFAEFHGMEFESVTFPESGRLIVIPRNFRAVARRADVLSTVRRDEIGKTFRRMLSAQSLQRPEKSETAGWVLAKRDWDDDELADFAAEILYAAQAEIAG
ncbi:pentapeptide repeat-containing protein [Actinoplanes sp. CA-142083]|uniref:pentapeptide repeat-containing protein n=1 Tax=Actinoplanes sp. CA-142083 TaxID=3239903 RepID=UPI003D90320F